MKEDKKVIKKSGIVVSDKMDKTIIVAVETLKTHKKYTKKYRSTKRYKVHDPENKHKTGEAVDFIQSRPLSKGKKFIVA